MAEMDGRFSAVHSVTLGALGTITIDGLVHQVSYRVATSAAVHALCACGASIYVERLDDKPGLVTCIACVIAKPNAVGWI